MRGARRPRRGWSGSSVLSPPGGDSGASSPFWTAIWTPCSPAGGGWARLVLDCQGREIAALLCAGPEQVEIREGDSPLDFQLCARGPGGTCEPLPWQELLLFTPFQPETEHPYGVSLLRSMPFLTDILLKIYQATGMNWERMGNVRFAVICRPGEGEGAYAQERCRQIAGEWSAAMQAGKQGAVRDFVAVGDLDIKVIGADNQVLDSQVPVRQILEQLVARTGIPPFLLGLSWSSTERMSAQQADLMTSEITALRRTLEPAVERICEMWLRLHGWGGDVTVDWAGHQLAGLRGGGQSEAVSGPGGSHQRGGTDMKVEKEALGGQRVEPTEEELALVNRQSRKELTAAEVYLFAVRLCDNEVDRDGEQFPQATLEQLAELFVGKSGIFDHRWSAGGQTARIYRTEVVREEGIRTALGEPACYLKGYAYMVRTQGNQDLIAEIEGGIKREVSVGCAVKRAECSICGSDMGRCAHEKGKRYDGRLCCARLLEATDAYRVLLCRSARPAQGWSDEAGRREPFAEAAGAGRARRRSRAGRSGAGGRAGAPLSDGTAERGGPAGPAGGAPGGGGDPPAHRGPAGGKGAAGVAGELSAAGGGALPHRPAAVATVTGTGCRSGRTGLF